MQKLVFVTALCLLAGACATRQQSTSTAVGATAGAVVGGSVGAVVGAGAGAGAGAPGALSMRSRATTARGVSCGGSSSTILKEPVPARPTGGAASVHPCRGRNGTMDLQPAGFRPSPVARARVVSSNGLLSLIRSGCALDGMSPKPVANMIGRSGFWALMRWARTPRPWPTNRPRCDHHASLGH
jgi:hypothetical protein